MASKPKTEKIAVDFPEEKLSVLTYCMQEKGLDLQQQLGDFLLSLYQKHVPKIMKGYVEAVSASALSAKKPQGFSSPSRDSDPCGESQGKNTVLD